MLLTKCLGCGKPFRQQNTDQRCSSCAESGTGPEPNFPVGRVEISGPVGVDNPMEKRTTADWVWISAAAFAWVVVFVLLAMIFWPKLIEH